MDRGNYFCSKPDLSFGEAIFLKTNGPHTFSISFWMPQRLTESVHVFFKTQFLDFTKLLLQEKTQLFHTEPSYVFFFVVVVRPFQNFGTPQLGQFWLKQENSTTNAPCGIQGYSNGPSCVLKHFIYRKVVRKNSCGHPSPPHMCTLPSAKNLEHSLAFFLPNGYMRKLFVVFFFSFAYHSTNSCFCTKQTYVWTC